jgi:uncharacterized membrane protein
MGARHAWPQIGPLLALVLLLVPLARADRTCPDPPTAAISTICHFDSEGSCIGPGRSGLGAYVYAATGGMALSLVEPDPNPPRILAYSPEAPPGPSGNAILGYGGSRSPHDRYYASDPYLHHELINGSMNLFQVDGVLFDASGTGAHPEMNQVAPTECAISAATRAGCTWDLNLAPGIQGVHVTLGTTLVSQAARLHLRATNGDTKAHAFAFRQSLYLTLDHEQNEQYDPAFMMPWVVVPNHGAYRDQEAEFSPVDFPSVKVWQQQTGPDRCGDAKAYPWWDPAWGGTAPDRVLVAHPESALPWGYRAQQVDHPFLGSGGTGMLLLYWGYAHPYHLEPGESVDLDWWYGRDVPPKLDTHLIDLAFSDDAASIGTPQARFSALQAGRSVDFPFEVRSSGTLGGQEKEEQVLVALEHALPADWQAQALLRNGLTPLPASLPVRTGHPVQAVLRITAGPGNHDGGVPMTVRVRANVLTSDPDLDPLASRLAAQIRATAVVPPSSGLLLVPSDDGPVAVPPGGEGIGHFNLTNSGNLGTLDVRLSALAAVGAGWSFSFDPAPVLAVGTGETVPVRVRVHAPAGAAPGRQEILVQARDAATGQSAQAGLAVRVVDPGRILLVPEAAALPIAPGAARLFQVRAVNQGSDAAPVTLRATPSGALPPGWSISLAARPAGGQLRPGTTPLAVQVRAPATALEGTRVEARLAVLDPAGVRQLANLTLVATVDRRVELTSSVPTQAIRLLPGQAQAVAVLVENHGNGVQEATVLPIADPPGLLVNRTPASLALGPGQNGTIQVAFLAGPDAPAGDYPVGLQVLDARGVAAPQDHPLEVTVEPVRRAEVTAEASRLTLRPGASLRVHGLVRNVGNVPESLGLAGLPSGWAAASPSFALQPGQQAPFQVDLRIPADAPLGAYNLTLRAVDAEGPVPDPAPSLVVTVAQPVLRVEGIELDGPPAAGRLVVGTVVVANRGNAAAPGLNVTVLAGGKAAQRGHLEALAPNRTAQVRFTLLLPAGPADLQAVVEAGNPTLLAPATAALHVEVAAAQASRLGAPLSLLALPALAIALALRRRQP